MGARLTGEERRGDGPGVVPVTTEVSNSQRTRIRSMRKGGDSL